MFSFNFLILYFVMQSKFVIKLTELTDLHNETVDESNKSDIGEKAISIDDTMMKLNNSVIEPDAEIFMTNSTLNEKSIKRKKRQSESNSENSNPESENQDQVTPENDNTLVTDNEISTPSEIPASDSIKFSTTSTTRKSSVTSPNLSLTYTKKPVVFPTKSQNSQQQPVGNKLLSTTSKNWNFQTNQQKNSPMTTKKGVSVHFPSKNNKSEAMMMAKNAQPNQSGTGIKMTTSFKFVG